MKKNNLNLLIPEIPIFAKHILLKELCEKLRSEDKINNWYSLLSSIPFSEVNIVAKKDYNKLQINNNVIFNGKVCNSLKEVGILERKMLTNRRGKFNGSGYFEFKIDGTAYLENIYPKNLTGTWSDMYAELSSFIDNIEKRQISDNT